MTTQTPPPFVWKQFFQTLPRGMLGGFVLFIVWCVLPLTCGLILLANINSAHHWLGGEDLNAAMIFAASYAVLTGIGVLPTYAATIVGGWVFGVELGFAACAAGYLGGSAIGFGISKLVCADHVAKWIDSRKRWAIIRKTILEENAFKATGIIALIRLSPSGPFAVTNLVLAACGAGWTEFLIGSSVGIAPRTLIACFMAASASATGATDIQTLAKNQGYMAVIVGILIFVATLAVIGWVARAALDRALRDETSAIR
ncbi:MAG: VTT domain-containing protein [Phycisphaerae bacterium]